MPLVFPQTVVPSYAGVLPLFPGAQWRFDKERRVQNQPACLIDTNCRWMPRTHVLHHRFIEVYKKAEKKTENRSLFSIFFFRVCVRVRQVAPKNGRIVPHANYLRRFKRVAVMSTSYRRRYQ